jgi:outer membrane protein OmpA-like peptidoglycan-associated protein
MSIDPPRESLPPTAPFTAEEVAADPGRANGSPSVDHAFPADDTATAVKIVSDFVEESESHKKLLREVTQGKSRAKRLRRADPLLPRLVPCVAGLAAVVAGQLFLASCQLLPSPTSAGGDRILPADPPSALDVALDSKHLRESSAAAASLLSATARPAEHVVVFCGQTALLSSAAPSGEVKLPAPAKPSDPPRHSTDFQLHEHKKALQDYDTKTAAVQRSLQATQRQLVASWVDSLKPSLTHAEQSCPSTRPDAPPAQSLLATLDMAETTFASLAEAGVDVGSRKAIAVLGVDGVPLTPSPSVADRLQGASVVVSPFPGGPPAQAGWQAALVQGGAGRAVLLAPGAEPELPTVVSEALGSIVYPLPTDVLFALGGASLQPSAQAPLDQLLQQLLGPYKTATAVVNGYADNLPAPGGNDTLSGNDILSQRRAEAVTAWLVAHGVASDRVQAVGHGDADPVAPNGPTGQPENRRVVVVINPAG